MDKNTSNKTTSKKIAFDKTYGNLNCSIAEQLNMSENDIQILHNKVIKAFPGIISFIEEDNKEENNNG